MTTFDDAVKAIKQHDAGFQAALESWPAYLGDGEGSVIGSDKSHYHCRYPTSESPAVEVFANGCPPVDGMRVTVGYSADQPKLIKVLSWTDPDLDNLTTPLQYHADQHAYLAGDTVWVDWRQITALKVQPYSGLSLYVNGGVLPRSGVDTLVVPQIVNLTGHLPSSSGLARYCLISLNTSGVVAITDGSDVATLSLDIADVPATPTGNFRLAAVALTYGQTTIEESITRTDILDLRWPQETIAGYLSPSQVTLARGSLIIGNASGVGAEYVLGAANKVLQSNGTDAVWSTNTLTISGNSTINGSLVGNITGGGTLATGGFTLTVPATGTAALGTGTTNTVTRWTGTNTLGNSIIQDDGATVGVGTAGESGALLTLRPLGTITSGTYNGLNMVLTANPASASSATYQGLAFSSQSATGNAQTITGSVRGVAGTAYHRGTANLTTLTGVDVQIGYLNTGNVTAARGIRLTEFKSSTGAPTVAYGLDIGDFTSGTSTNAAINTAKGSIRFGDYVTVTGWQDARQLDVLGHTTQTNEVARIRRNDSATATANNVLLLGANSTGTAAAGFGGAIALNLESSTTADQSAAALEWSWATATHASRKARVVGKVYDTAARTWLQVDTDGSTSDVLINSLIYGSMYGDDISQLVTVDASSTYYEVGGGLTGGSTNGMTFQNSKELLVTVAGKYLVTWSMSLSAGNNDHLEGAVMINSTVAASTENAAHTPGAGDQVPVGGSGILTLAVNDVVKLCVENETDTDDITVSHAALTAVRIGE